jgi:hypothetical protein
MSDTCQRCTDSNLNGVTMKSIKALLVLALAASFSSGSFAAAEPPAQLIKVPKNEAAMEATRATIARDAANAPAKPAVHKAKPGKAASANKRSAKQGKAAPTAKSPAKQSKAASSQQRQAKPGKAAPANKHPAKALTAKK